MGPSPLHSAAGSNTPDSRMFGGSMVVSSLVNWLGSVSEEGCSLPARMGWLSSEAFCPIWPKAMTCTAQEVGPKLGNGSGQHWQHSRPFSLGERPALKGPDKQPEFDARSQSSGRR